MCLGFKVPTLGGISVFGGHGFQVSKYGPKNYPGLYVLRVQGSDENGNSYVYIYQ